MKSRSIIVKVLVTGATGFIGSHTCVELINAGYNVIVIDNFVNSKSCVLDKIKRITGKGIDFLYGDVTDKKTVELLFDNHDISAVIHFAGLKAVGESVHKPSMYYHNNLMSTITLCDVTQKYRLYLVHLLQYMAVLKPYLYKKHFQRVELQTLMVPQS